MRRLILLALFIATQLFAADAVELTISGVDEAPVSIKNTTAMAVSATNAARAEPAVFVAISVERKGSDGKFTSFRFDIVCPCNAKCKKAPVTLQKTESVHASWNMLSNDCHKVLPGVYRFAVIDRYSEAISDFVYYGVSKEFIVTE
jgi:hypothetical protein